LAENFCLAIDNIDNEAHNVASNISIFLNAKFVCRLASINISPISDAGMVFGQKGGQSKKT